MWPKIDFANRKISGQDFYLKQTPRKEERGNSPNVKIKEIVMIYACYRDVEYNHEDVACAVEYDTEIGKHTILFSKKAHLEYKNKGVDWIAIYTSDYQPDESYGDGCDYSIPVDVLTELYRSCWPKIKSKVKTSGI